MVRIHINKRFLLFFSAIVFVYTLGVCDYMFTRDYDKDFDYPLNIELGPLVREAVKLNRVPPKVLPINYYPYYFMTAPNRCTSHINILIIVKSAMNHFGHREAIRQTYGRYEVPGKKIVTLFFLGIDRHNNSHTQIMIRDEVRRYNDIVQMSFIDNYYNNTIKTMMSFRYGFERCPADFYLFTDDDMYISVDNLINYLYSDETLTRENEYEPMSSIFSSDKDLFAGYVFKSSPQRIVSSKWWVSLKEYPWNKWPPYITAGAYIVSYHALSTIYVGSYFVEHFRFDDIYLGIIAKKIDIKLTHCSQIYYYKKKYSKEGYKDVIASHGYGDHEELKRVWFDQHPGTQHSRLLRGSLHVVHVQRNNTK